MENNNQDHRAAQNSGAGGKTMQVLDALKSVALPGSKTDIVSAGAVKNLVIEDEAVRFDLALAQAEEPLVQAIIADAERALEQLPWISSAQVGVTSAVASTPPPPPHGAPAPQQQVTTENLLPNVRHVIAVGSGKGGVGKSTVSLNLALALAGLGQRVGLMDADVYGPSLPLMLGVQGHPQIGPDEKIIPIEKHGIRLMSMGLLLQPDQAVVWRGPMVHSAVRQFLADVNWGDLDYLIIDLPPGTGDAPLSLAQALPLTAAVIVTTPQEVAAAVAQKAMSMFNRMGIRILGVIENMSYFVCPHCKEISDVFDRGGGKQLADRAEVPFLGEIPLDTRMRTGGDVGEPVMSQFPESELAQAFTQMAQRLHEAVVASH